VLGDGAAPKPWVPPADTDERMWTASEPVRLVSSIGASGASTADLEPTIGFGTRNSFRASQYATIGIRTQLLMRNWSETGRFYGYIADCEKIDTRCDKRADYWPIGWMMVFANAEVGWDFMVRPEGPHKPWLSIGSALVLYQSGKGLGEDGPAEGIVGHAGTLGFGYDFEVVGIGFRTSIARDWLLFGTTGAPLVTALLSIDVLLPRNHPDRYVKRKK
jgi:hypothetical protein